MSMVPFTGSGMPAWLASALRLIFTGRTATGVAAGGALASLPGLETPFGIPGVDLFPNGKPRRRRRRRALTASDRADIAFIAGMLGAPAGRQFAMLIGSRTAS